jgi:hypothetical protein
MEKSAYEELCDLYFSPNIIRVIKSRRMSWVAYMAHMGDKNYAYRVLVAKLEGKRSLPRHRCRCKASAKMYRTEMGWDSRDWIHLVQYRDM